MIKKLKKKVQINYNVAENIKFNLGLAIAKPIVEQYNGKIEVQCSDGITTFKVTII